MKEIDLALQPISGYLISIKRNTVDGWYELEIGLPKTWVFDENNKISCEVLNESDSGKLIKISPRKSDVLIDDLISFVEIIIKTNQQIAEKELEFSEIMQEMKGVLEDKAKKFYKELDELKESSFKIAGDKFVDALEDEKPKRGRPKGSKNTKKTVTEEITVVESTKE